MTDPDALARLAVMAAEDLDDRTPPGRPTVAPLLRRLAATVLDLLDQLDRQAHEDAARCPCGRQVAQPPTGRRRRWCQTCRPPRGKRRETRA
jgi:hypothetical protein